MFYIENDNKIVLFDEDKEKLQDTIAFTMPQYLGLEIKEVEEGYVIYDFELMTVEEKEEKEAQKERERLDKLSMTRGDVFEALILARGLTKPQIRAMIENAELDDITKALYLNRFDEALSFFRGHPVFDFIGNMLNITSTQMDDFFEEKAKGNQDAYKYLTNCKFILNVTPENATVIINNVEQSSIELPYATNIEIVVKATGYKSYSNSFILTENKTTQINLEKIEITENQE